MREIKFRIWDKKNKVMMVDWQNFKFIKTIGKDSFLRLGTSRGKWVLNIAKLEDYIPMQYTGALDKKGKEIYEGDIVNCSEYGCYGKIYWDEELFSFMFATLCEDGTLFNERFYDYVDDMEIIGSIYENPELLEVE